MKSCFVKNGDLFIHVLENGKPLKNRPSLLIVCGLWEPAERAIPVLSKVKGHVVALSLRGRGLSSTPETGYDLEDHMSDISAVVNHCKLENYCVLGFSRGAAYALGWSLKHQLKMSGLILVNQPPLHRSLSSEDVTFWCQLEYQGIPLLNFMRKSAFEGLGREASHIDFSNQLPELKIPVSIFYGSLDEAEIPSNLNNEVLEVYKKSISRCQTVEFSKSGHMIPDEEEAKYIFEINRFLDEVNI